MPMHPEVARAHVYKYRREDGANFVEYATLTSFGKGTFSVEKMHTNDWHLGLVKIRGDERKGIGTHLIQAFVIDVGPNNMVYGSVIHPQTFQALIDLGYEKLAIDLGTLVLTDHRMMDFPAIQLLSKGGIKVSEVVLEYWETQATHGGPNAFFYTGVTTALPRSFTIIDTEKK